MVFSLGLSKCSDGHYEHTGIFLNLALASSADIACFGADILEFLEKRRCQSVVNIGDELGDIDPACAPN